MGIEGYYEDYFDDREEPKKLTNYDKIRNMTIDEMVQLLEGDCFRCAYCKLGDCWDQDCDNGHKQWLKQESEE